MTNTLATFAPELSTVNGKITTTSQQIAEHFDKRHADVIRAIRKLDLPAEFNERNFALVEIIDSKGEKRPCYQITRDGFTLLAMGFTGKEALQWKLAYINAFNKMEAALQAPAALPTAKSTVADRKGLVAAVNMLAQGSKLTYSEVNRMVHHRFSVAHTDELTIGQVAEAIYYVHSLNADAPQTLNATVDRLAHQLKERGSYPVEVFMPLWKVINDKLALPSNESLAQKISATIDQMVSAVDMLIETTSQLQAVNHGIGRGHLIQSPRVYDKYTQIVKERITA